MPKRLSEITDTFTIEGRGFIAVLEDESKWAIPSTEAFHEKELIRVRNKTGDELKTFIKAIQSLGRSDRGPTTVIVFPKNITQQDVAKGDIIYLERDGSEPLLWDGTPPRITKA